VYNNQFISVVFHIFILLPFVVNQRLSIEIINKIPNYVTVKGSLVISYCNKQAVLSQRVISHPYSTWNYGMIPFI